MHIPKSNIKPLWPDSSSGTQRLVVLGGAESGIGAAILAKQKGYEVFLSDGKSLKPNYKAELESLQIDFEENGHTEAKILSADVVVKSPGIPEKNELVQKIRTQQIPIISEIELAYWYKGEAKIIAITGSNGKSTTTSLIHHICEGAGFNCALVGNIGYSFAKQVAEDPKEWYIVEVSSFQLDDIVHFRPHIALLLNITEDHLDRYDYKMDNYIYSKFRIRENQTEEDYFIYCEDDAIITEHLKIITLNTNTLTFSMKHEIKKGSYIKGGNMILKIQEERVSMSIYDFALKGKHNLYNSMAAGIAASIAGIRKEKIRECVGNFQGLGHRNEFVASVRGVEFINDSKATNVNSTWFALESYDRPVVLILGGQDKGNDYSILDELVKKRVKAIVCLGKDNSKIVKHFKNIVPAIRETSDMATCVKTCFRMSTKGDVVLLSPACASFDLFNNFQERGQAFRDAVREL